MTNSSLKVTLEKIDLPKMEDYQGPYNVRPAEVRE